ncbi:probable ATP-dependent RNA helicase DDX46 [Drosophila ficusphila]|uniref:probable ATP-dependent RNA helicase DDX46 n=1 Tax=Drosophila ficusphila TaxID=30025 RepID=UPI001C8A2B12|nr:probable ATP-dependent RNA helicase DDX46 [Drosophila ficusphila]
MEREIAHNLSPGDPRTSDVAPGQVKTFGELRLCPYMLRGLKRHNFLTPTKIQAAAIPMALSNMDLLVQSKSGTGKTLIYLIAAMQSYRPQMTKPHALIVVPTRELAIQVEDTFRYLCEFFPHFKCASFIGGTDVARDRRRINQSRVIIGTPGRLLHLYENRVLDVSKLGLLVLDEADQLYQTKGLQETVHKILKAVPKRIQIIACSATYDQDLDVRLAKIMKTPMLISNSERATVLLGIRQFVYELPKQINSVQEMRLKLEILTKIFEQLPYEQAVLFASSQMRADSYRNYLTAGGVQCNLISGAMEQSERLDVFEGYRNFTMRTLVATDLMARGVDSPHANLVINLDPPQDYVTYLHRIGRAGRFGSKGIAITFITSEKEAFKFKQMVNKAATAWSVLEFPKEPMPKDFNFWDFDKYNFEYYIKESNPLQEMPAKPANPVLNANHDQSKEDKPTVSSKEQSEALEKTQKQEDTVKKLKKNQENIQCGSKNKQEALANVGETDKDIKNNNSKTIQSKEKVDMENAPHTSQKNANINIIDVKQGNTCSKPEEALKAKDKEIKISKKTRQISPSKIFADALLQIEKQTSPTEKAEKQLTPVIKVNEYYLKVYLETGIKSSNEKENQPDNGAGIQLQAKSTLNPEEMISPELTPTLTPLDLTHEPSPTTVSPPAPPVNSINNKTYCLAAPTQTSSMTIQNMVISNTVDDASSISSDSMGCGYHSDKSYDTIYTSSDEGIIWERFESNRKKRLLKRVKGKRHHLLCQRPEPNSKPKVKRNFKLKKLDMYKNVSLLPRLNLNYLLNKMKNREQILERLYNYSKKHKMDNEEVGVFLDNLYDAMLELYYINHEDLSKLVSESLKDDLPSLVNSPSQESIVVEPQNKLSVHVTHRMDIPPLPQANIEVVAESGSESEDSEFNEHDDDDDDEEELSDEHNSSSGFVESNESASSGIDTSVYETDSTDDEEYGLYSPDFDDSEGGNLESSEADVGSAEEEDDEDTASNVSLAGSSTQGSVEESSANESLEGDDSDTLTDVNPMRHDNSYAQSLWHETFQMQYQFIASHVANNIRNNN